MSCKHVIVLKSIPISNKVENGWLLVTVNVLVSCLKKGKQGREKGTKKKEESENMAKTEEPKKRGKKAAKKCQRGRKWTNA